ncbi:hypothetical protein [Actinomadura sp. 6N118]|uniref:hypothetical protein n=1 Tax=Actinomadura sp. 6N118 TaxID=3375151 RepID=UPI0037A8F275
MPSTMLLEVDGVEITAEDLAALVELQAEEATAEADAVTVTFRADASPDGEWPSLLDPLVTPRTPLVVQLTRGDVGYRFDGYSAEAVWDIDAEGGSRLTVKAVDRSLDLDAEEKALGWPGQRDSAIAETIFGSYGLDTEVEKTPDAPEPDVHIAMQRATDWAYVRALAAKWGYAAYLEAAADLGIPGAAGTVTGHFHPIDPLADPQGEIALGFGGDAFKAQVRVDLLGGQRVVATRWPALAAAAVTADGPGDDEPQGADSLAAQVTTLLTPDDVTGEVDPQEAASALARRSAYTVTLTATLDTERIGLLLRARRPVLVRGLGSVLSGRYLVDKVRHTVTLEAHRQEVTLKRNALGVTGDEPFGATGGLLGGLL